MSAEQHESGRREELLHDFTVTAALAFWSYPQQYETLEAAAGGVIQAMDDQQLAEFLPVYVSEFIGEESNPWVFDPDSLSISDGTISGRFFGSKESLAKHIIKDDFANRAFSNYFHAYLKDIMLANGYADEDVEYWWLDLGDEEELRIENA